MFLESEMGFWPHVELDALNGRGGLAGLRSAWREHSETSLLSPNLNPSHKASLILALGPPLPPTQPLLTPCTWYSLMTPFCWERSGGSQDTVILLLPSPPKATATP